MTWRLAPNTLTVSKEGYALPAPVPFKGVAGETTDLKVVPTAAG